ncbi:UPF0545 protein C22orf39-like protein [Frankliniella fusca]|uniref:Synaptic plasticity regulator PANTS n=1 Tax=Frankliniella fusca TaxID=407009 RepID=A0AAE1LIU0_9NEOP|nr:UPF0545 protein C22orf39-like protein [Frankliniella fusca]
MVSSSNGDTFSEKSIIQSPPPEGSLEYRLIRPCDRYEDEYNECKSSKSRRQQIFVYGQTIDCESWAKDFENCKKWTWASDEEAARSVIESERKRLHERLIPHMQNKVWEKRDGAPPGWNKPLPEFEAQNQDSYLTLMKDSDEKGGGSSTSSGCMIQ